MEALFVQTGSTEARVAELGEFYTVGTVDIIDSDADEYILTLYQENKGDSDSFVVTIDREEESHWLQVGQERRIFNDSFTVHVKGSDAEQSATYRLTVRAVGTGEKDDVPFTVHS